MRLRLTRSTNITSSSSGGDGNQDGQEGLEHPDGDNHDMEKDEESLSGADKEKEEEEVVIVTLGKWTPTTESLPLTIIKEMEEMFLRLGFSQKVTQKLVDD